ncbi:ABC transporter substrate-binding protein [Mycolicibacterium vaccae]|uniref:ABC transporter substrate-binding protein n=1 Tax=Mycolicibacterium vaccae TaxID=1810 RepID=UPI003CE67B82
MKKTALLAVAIMMTLSGCSFASPDSSSTPAAASLTVPEDLAPEPGIDIPQVTVKAGFAPYGDGLIGVAGERLGFFRDAGISFSQPNGIQADFSKSFTPMLNGQVEVGSAYMPFFAQQLDTVTSVRAFVLTDVYLGTRILAPVGQYQTVEQLMAQGQTFEEAAGKVMAQLRGKKMLMPDGVDPTFHNLALGEADMTLSDVNVVRMSNADIVRAAQAGDTDFAAPDGAVQITQLQQSGWEPVVTIGQVIDAMPDQTLDVRNTHTAFTTTADFAEDNYNTLLRYAGVTYRIIDALERDPQGTAAVFTDYLNSYTGSDLSVDEVAGLFSNGLYSYRGFDEAADFLGPSTTSPFVFDETATAQLATLKENGVLIGDRTPADMSIANKVYEDLKAYQEQSQDLINSAPEGALKQQARTFYDQFNFLDAYRYAQAANES